MSEKTLNTRIILRNATSAEWAESSVDLSVGELAIDTSNSTIKIGNGGTWANANRLSVAESDVIGLCADINTVEQSINDLDDRVNALSSGTKFIAIVDKQSDETEEAAIRRYYVTESKQPAKGHIMLVRMAQAIDPVTYITSEWICTEVTEEEGEVTDSVWEKFGDPSAVAKTVDGKISDISSTISATYLSASKLMVSSDNTEYNALSVIKLTPEEFEDIVKDDEKYDRMRGDTLYVVEGEEVEPFYGKRLTGVLSGTDNTDAVNVKQLTDAIAAIPEYTLSVATNDRLGGVKTSDEISASTGGVLGIVSVDIMKLGQAEGDVLVLNGGSAN